MSESVCGTSKSTCTIIKIKYLRTAGTFEWALSRDIQSNARKIHHLFSLKCPIQFGPLTIRFLPFILRSLLVHFYYVLRCELHSESFFSKFFFFCRCLSTQCDAIFFYGKSQIVAGTCSFIFFFLFCFPPTKIEIINMPYVGIGGMCAVFFFVLC